MGQAEAKNAVGKETVIAELEFARPEAAQAAFGLGQGLPVVFFEQCPVLLGNAVGLAGLVRALQEPQRKRMAVDEQVFVGRFELLLVGSSR